nr:translation initiation factor IF-2 [Oryctolagus cuniculus]
MSALDFSNLQPRHFGSQKQTEGTRKHEQLSSAPRRRLPEESTNTNKGHGTLLNCLFCPPPQTARDPEKWTPCSGIRLHQHKEPQNPINLPRLRRPGTLFAATHPPTLDAGRTSRAPVNRPGGRYTALRRQHPAPTAPPPRPPHSRAPPSFAPTRQRRAVPGAAPVRSPPGWLLPDRFSAETRRGFPHLGSVGGRADRGALRQRSGGPGLRRRSSNPFARKRLCEENPTAPRAQPAARATAVPAALPARSQPRRGGGAARGAAAAAAGVTALAACWRRRGGRDSRPTVTNRKRGKVIRSAPSPPSINKLRAKVEVT